MDPTEFEPHRPIPSLKRRLPYIPVLLAAKPTRLYRRAPFTGLLLDQIQSAGIVQYRFIFTVFEHDDAEDPSLVISSELFAGGPQYVVGAFTEHGHETVHSVDDDWADEETFCQRALELVRERLGVSLVQMGRAKPWWKFW